MKDFSFFFLQECLNLFGRGFKKNKHLAQANKNQKKKENWKQINQPKNLVKGREIYC